MICVICTSRQATEGYTTCPECSDRLLSRLAEVEELQAEVYLTESAVPSQVRSSSGVHSKPGPRSPARDDVISLRDPRGGIAGGSVGGVLGGWSILIADETNTTSGGIEHIRRWWDHVNRQRWVSAFAKDIDHLLVRMRSALGITEDKGVGVCECKGTLRYTPSSHTVSCTRCPVVIDAGTLLATPPLESEGYLPTGQAAQTLGVPPGTVRQWVRRGRVPRDGEGRVDMVSLRTWLANR